MNPSWLTTSSDSEKPSMDPPNPSGESNTTIPPRSASLLSRSAASIRQKSQGTLGSLKEGMVHKRTDSLNKSPSSLDTVVQSISAPVSPSKSGSLAYVVPTNARSMEELDFHTSTSISESLSTNSNPSSHSSHPSSPTSVSKSLEDQFGSLTQALMDHPKSIAPSSLRLKSYSQLSFDDRYQVQWTAYSMLTQLFTRANATLDLSPTDFTKLTDGIASSTTSHRTRSSAGQWIKSKFGKKEEVMEKTGVFDVPLQKSIVYASVPLDPSNHSLKIPIVLFECAQYLRKGDRLDVAGLFRVSGSERRIQQKIPEFDKPPRFGLGGSMEGVTPHDVAAILKRWIRSLPEPLFTTELRHCFLQVADLPREESKQWKALRLLVAMLPPEHLVTAEYLFGLLKEVADHSDQNQMTAHNLARVLAPNLLLPPSQTTDVGGNSGFDSINEYEIAAEIVEMMILSYGIIGAPFGRWTCNVDACPAAISVLEDDPVDLQFVGKSPRPLSFVEGSEVPLRRNSFENGDETRLSGPIVAVQEATLPRPIEVTDSANGATTACSSLETSPVARQSRKKSISDASSDDFGLLSAPETIKRRISAPGERQLRRRDASRASEGSTDTSVVGKSTIGRRKRTKPRKPRSPEDGNHGDGEDLPSKRGVQRSMTAPLPSKQKKRSRRQRTEGTLPRSHVKELEKEFAAFRINLDTRIVRPSQEPLHV